MNQLKSTSWRQKRLSQLLPPVQFARFYSIYNYQHQEIKFIKFFYKCSNSAAKDIAQLTLSLDKQVKDRNEFDLKLFQSEIQNSIYHNKGKLKNERGLN